MVERRWEQAAEVVPIPLLWRGARQGGVVEQRLERAAEGSRKEGRGVKEDYGSVWLPHADRNGIGWSFPHQRECIYKPLDSGLRRNDGMRKIRVIQALHRSRIQSGSFCLVVIPNAPVIPAKAGIQEGGPRGCREFRLCLTASYQPGCHSRISGNVFINHWIPACAGMTTEWKSAFSRHSTLPQRDPISCNIRR